MKFWCGLLAVWLGGFALQARAMDEDRQLAAVFIGRFASYVSWPAQAQTATREYFIITILDRNPFNTLLDQLYRDKRIHDKPVQLRYVARLEDVGATDVLFITQPGFNQRLQAIRYAQQNGILTISEAKGFAESGGIIQFDFVMQKVQIRINRGAAIKSGLKIAAPLLGISQVLQDETTP